MGVFEFIIVLVLISTVGKVLTERPSRRELKQGREKEPRRLGSTEAEILREQIDELNGRLTLIEEERDFYKDLLDAPAPPKKIDTGAPRQAEPPEESLTG